MRARVFAIALLLSAAPARYAGAEPEPPTGEETRNAARELARDAVTAHDAGDFGRALDLIDRAHRLVPAPTISIWQARILAKMGRLIEANERYENTRRAALPADAPDAFRAAVVAAGEEVEVLRKRIPRIRVRVSGPGSDSASLVVTLDGKRVPPELLGVARTVDPGSHHLDASVPGVSAVRRRIEVAEAGSESITLELSPLDASGTSGARGVGTPPPGGGSSRQTWGWVATGVGLAGVATGIGFGIAAQNKRADLEGACSGGRCPPSREETLDAFRTQRTVAWVGYGVGAAAFASAAVLFFVLPDDRPTTGVHPWVGPGSAGMAGRF